MSWSLLIQTVRPHVVKISTPSGFGTGFLAFYNHNKTWVGIATAAHVVAYADEWQLPIRLFHPESLSTAIVGPQERVIFIDHKTDSAVMLLFEVKFQLPETPIALLPMSEPCGLGVDVGWLGFPVVEPNTLCFFSGAISARIEANKAYMIDGVAINGVSGGPVFHTSHSGGAQIIGCVSAYHPNMATGHALPGLLKAQDVSHFHGVAEHIRTVDEAQRKKAEFDAAQKPQSNVILVPDGTQPQAGSSPTFPPSS